MFEGEAGEEWDTSDCAGYDDDMDMGFDFEMAGEDFGDELMNA